MRGKRLSRLNLLLLIPVGMGLMGMRVMPQPQEAPTEQQWEQAARQIKRLPPSAFKELPAPIIKELEAEGCTIPQAPEFAGKKLSNVIEGHFAKENQKDWAVLCSKGGKSAIRIFWGGPAKCASTIHNLPDEGFLQGHEDGKIYIYYSRLLTAVSEKDVRGYASPPDPGVMRHDGIDDAHAGKVSSIEYCHEGKWSIVASAD